MDDYSIGTARADEFDVANQLVYSAGALVRSSDSFKSAPLSTDFDPEADHIVFVSFEKTSHIIGAQKNLIATLFQNWNLPKIAIDHLFSAEDTQGFFTTSSRSIRCCWYHVPVECFNDRFEYSMLHVWQVLDVDTAHIRVLVLYPPFMKADMVAALPSFFADISGHENLQWSHIHLILIRVAIATWQRTRWAVMALGTMRVCSDRDFC